MFELLLSKDSSMLNAHSDNVMYNTVILISVHICCKHLGVYGIHQNGVYGIHHARASSWLSSSFFKIERLLWILSIQYPPSIITPRIKIYRKLEVKFERQISFNLWKSTVLTNKNSSALFFLRNITSFIEFYGKNNNFSTS